MEISCPSCSKKYSIPKPGRYRCQACHTLLPEVPSEAGAFKPGAPAPAPPAAPRREATSGLPRAAASPASGDAKAAASTSGTHRVPGAGAGEPRAAAASTGPAAGVPAGSGTSSAPPTPAQTPTSTPPPLEPEVAARAAELERLIGVNPRAKGPYAQLATLYEAAGRKDLAIGALRRILALEPQNAFIANRIAILEGKAESRKPVETARSAHDDAAVRTTTRKALRVALGVAAVVVLAVLALVLAPVLFPSERPVAVFSYAVSGARFSPDGSRIAYVAANGGESTISIYDVQARSTRVFPVKMRGYWGQDYLWTPNGLEIAFEGRSDEEDDWASHVYLLDVLDGSVKEAARGSSPTFTSRESSMVLVCDPEMPARADYSDVREWPRPFLCRADLVTKSNVRLTDKPATEAVGQPMGSLVVFQVDEEVDWEEWTASVRGPAGGGDGSSGPEGTQMLENALAGKGSGTAGGASKGLEREVKAENRREKAHEKTGDPNAVWDASKSDLWLVEDDGSGLRQLTQDHHSSDPVWTKDGKHVLYACRSDDGQSRRLCLIDPDGSNRRVLDLGDAEVPRPESVGLTPDTRRVVYHQQVPGVDPGMAMTMTRAFPADLYERTLGSKKAARRVKTKHQFKQGFDLSPDGRLLVYENTNKDKGFTELWMTKL